MCETVPILSNIERTESAEVTSKDSRRAPGSSRGSRLAAMTGEPSASSADARARPMPVVPPMIKVVMPTILRPIAAVNQAAPHLGWDG
ncbi:hypothetical protein Afil01_60460 [Actinorhabdospora filicis]|uniref:Uncharacterized protein n=1 Tax=Actinorhabdospora filicis TaxID=1785913 RepID=A0A9W6SQT1_9ACTN|nr:hypothetical protein Afil01_60460 [Actinorhabdospora filicis]